MTLGAFTYVYNMLKYDYPFEESVRSVIDVVDQFVICECRSDDGTAELVARLAAEFPTKIKVVHRNWVMHFTEISSVANFAMDALETDYAFQLQADEIVHHDSLDVLRTTAEQMAAAGKTGGRVHYTHFMANYETTFPFCYDTLVRVAKRHTPWRIIGDGVQFAYSEHDVPEDKVFDTGLQVFHYGKVKDPKKGWQKEWDFQQLYLDIGFPDKRMMEMKNKIGAECDYVYLFKEHVVNKTIKHFEGTHPIVMLDRIKAFKSAGFEQFVSEMEKNLSISL